MNQRVKSTRTHKKLLYLCAAIFMGMTVAAYVAYLFGNRYFILPSGYNSENQVADCLVSLFLFSLNLFLWIGCCVEASIKELLFYTVLYIPVWFIGALIIQISDIYCFYIPVIYILLLGLLKKNNVKLLLQKTAINTAFIFVYQWLTKNFRLGLQQFRNEFVMPIDTKIWLQLDILSMLVILYGIGGEKIVSWFIQKVVKHTGLGLQYNLAVRGSYGKGVETAQTLEEYSELSDKDKLPIALRYLAGLILQLFLISAISIYGNIWQKVLLIFLSFCIFRFVLKLSWHSKIPIVCIATSILLFCGSAFLIPSLKQSLFIPIIIGLLIAGSLFHIAVYKVNAEENKQFRDNIEMFDINRCTRQELIERFKLCEIPIRNLDFCLSAFIDHKSEKELAQMYNIEPSSARTKKWYMAKRLNRYTEKSKAKS